MKYRIKRNSIEIEPENEQDQAFIEDTLGMIKDGVVGEIIRKGMTCQKTPGFGAESKNVVSKLIIQKKSKA